MTTLELELLNLLEEKRDYMELDSWDSEVYNDYNRKIKELASKLVNK